MNFTSDIKKELISRHTAITHAEKLASLSAFVRTSGILGVKDGSPTFFLVSETENVAEYFTAVFSEVFQSELAVTHATRDRMSGRDKLLLQCPINKAEEVLKALRLLKKTGEPREGISSALVAEEKQKIAYIKGAFLGGGSCILPSEDGRTGYHLELVFSDKKTAKDFCGLLAEFEILARQTQRKETFVAYIKSKEQISDFLAVVGAKHALNKFSKLVETRDKANQNNRARNCISGNADKVAIAAVKQIVALKKLQEKGILNEVSEELQTLAKARMEQPTLSLQELADSLKISKSCLNHRIRRLMELSAKLDENKDR